METSIQQKLVASADDAANHTALLKLLERKGLLDPADLEFYYQERIKAKEHLVLMSGLFGVVAMMEEVHGDPEFVSEIVTELGLGDYETATARCKEALDYLYLHQEDKAKLLEALAALPRF